MKRECHKILGIPRKANIFYYVLQDKETERYICDSLKYTKENPVLTTSSSIAKAFFYHSLKQAQEELRRLNINILVIKKVRIIDLGEV